MNNQIQELINTLLKFRQDRDWEQFHTAKNLAISISIEAAELLEHFQWLRGDEDPSKDEILEITKEIADIFIYLLLISNDLRIDIIEASKKKIEENNQKYPVEKARGTAKKYKEL